jgi:hypothetical protein
VRGCATFEVVAFDGISNGLHWVGWQWLQTTISGSLGIQVSGQGGMFDQGGARGALTLVSGQRVLIGHRASRCFECWGVSEWG